MRVPLDAVWPAGYRCLQLVHLDHLLDVGINVRTMLLLSSAVSLTFSVAWLLDVVQLTCFASAPWKESGIGSWSCALHLFGGLSLAFMFQHSATALAYYDEGGEELRQKKERVLSEMQRQTGDVLARATGQARRLRTMLSADLDEKVCEHVLRMRAILGKIGAVSCDRHAGRVHELLVVQMARHLHSLRQPALTHFEKLMKLSGQAGLLRATLRQLRHDSMVRLLTGKSDGVPRTDTVMDDGPTSAEGLLGGSEGSHQQLLGLFNWCQPLEDAEASLVRTIKRQASVDAFITVPTEADLAHHLRPVSAEDHLKRPDKVVLQPLNLVLEWLEKMAPKPVVPESGYGVGQANLHAGAELIDTAGSFLHQASDVVRHIRRSPLYRCILAGVACSVGFFFAYAHMLGVCWAVLTNGECHGQVVFACGVAVLRKLFGMLSMACYTVSLSIVLWNIERLDAVMQVQAEIHDLEDFKRQVDHLNTHDLTENCSSASVIQSVENALVDQKRLVSSFFMQCWGDAVPISSFEDLAHELEGALGRTTAKLSSGVAPNRASQSYFRLTPSTDEESQPLAGSTSR